MSASRPFINNHTMESKLSLIEPLFERVEQYSKTSFELIKLKAVSKSAIISASLFSIILFTIVFSILIISLNIALALWLGDIVGKNYYGFLLVAAFYALVAIVLFLVNPSLKRRVNNSMIKQMLN